MASNLAEKVVADREKFSLRLSVPPSRFDKVGKPLVTGGVCAAVGVMVTNHVIVPATVIKVLGVTLYASSGPVGWAIGAGAVAFGVGVSAHALGRKAKERFGTTGTYKKDFDGSLSEIGELVADIVFRPMVALAMSDWSDDKRKYILNEFDRWGYDRVWARHFLQGLCECSDDVLGPTMEIISCKGFRGRNIKDKAIAKRHLLNLAIENLNAAASDFGGDQRMVQERKGAICRQLR